MHFCSCFVLHSNTQFNERTFWLFHATTFLESRCHVEHRNCGQFTTINDYNEQLNVAYAEYLSNNQSSKTEKKLKILKERSVRLP